jgi:nucleotide-binding universal stress UspA family protein
MEGRPLCRLINLTDTTERIPPIKKSGARNELLLASNDRRASARSADASNMKKPSIRTILVPIDFSKMSIQAIETAQRLAKRLGATIHLVHVHEYYYPMGFMAPGAPVPMSMVTFREDAAQRITSQLRALAKKLGIPTTNCYIQNDAPVFNEICKVARQVNADLIVTPTHGYTGLTHFFEGSTAERIVQHSPCPVYVAKQNGRLRKSTSKPGATFGIDKILVPVDFSDCSLEGLKYAIHFADKFAAKILLLNAVHFGYAYTADGYGMYDLSRLQEAGCKGAEEQMRRIVRRAKFGGVKFETRVKVGLPVDQICAFAQDNDVDLIITSTHGRTGFKHVLIGSTAEQVVRRANRPVLVVPSHPEERVPRLTRGTRRAQQPKGLGMRRRQVISTAGLTKTNRTLLPHPFPERRKTNKFRESHSA